MTSNNLLPQDANQATLIGRIWRPDIAAPCLVLARPDGVFDATPVAATSADLMAQDAPAEAISTAFTAGKLPKIADLSSVQGHAACEGLAGGAAAHLHWLAPCDLQAIKAAGVTFVASMLERVIEEQARGDAARAAGVREAITQVIGENLRALKPGSAQAMQVKALLIERGMWSQYLEVGIGKDAEIFTKSQAMSAVGTGAQVGIHPESHWNNPEPEIVLCVSPSGQVQGAALGNDVNLRDVEGRSALLLGKAKDNNASCAIGPFIRLFDAHFSINDVRQCDLAMQVTGNDGFEMQGASSLKMISRDPLDLVAQTLHASHQYPDGFMLFLGTMFAPTQDRHGPGTGFTHAVGDVVRISTPLLGCLANAVNTSDKVAPWTFGVRDLMRSLARRGVL